MSVLKKKRLLALSLVFLFIPSISVFANGQAPDNSLVSKITFLVFQLALITFAAWTGGLVFKKFKLPGVLGEITAGVLIGPYLLGSLPIFGFPQGMFPLQADFPLSIELYGIATIASIMLLFLAGLETDINTFLRFSFAGSVVGISGVVFSFILGDLTGVILSAVIFGKQYGFADPVPLFMGVISIATSVGISARILSDKRKMDSPEGITIVSAAMIDDVLGIIILAIVIGIAKSAYIDWNQVSLVASKAIIIWLGFTTLGIIFASRVSIFLKKFKDRATISIMSFALALFLAGIFEKSGLAMIIGAYVMGLSLSRTDLCFIIRDNLSVLQKFFVPIFFCVMGMLVNLKEMASVHILLFGAIYMVVAVLSKLIGCGLPARFLNFNNRGALSIGVGMVPRGEVALIVAGIGLSLRIIPHDIFTISVLMTFVTTLITPSILEKLIDTDKPMLVKKVPSKIEHKEIYYEMPNPETAELILNKVITAFDNEGFYIHMMKIPEFFYQIRKNETFITLKFTPEKLLFTCQPQDASFVHTLFYEVIGEFENIIKNLHSLINKDQVGKSIFAAGNGVKKDGMKIHKIISPLAVEYNLRGDTKKKIIAELVDLLIKSGQLNSSKREEVVNDLFDRESVVSTGMQDGIALPHIKTRSVKKIISALGIKKEGVDFGSLDKKSSNVFVIIIAPKSPSQPYLQYLAEVSKFLISTENRLKMLSANNNDELYSVLLNC